MWNGIAHHDLRCLKQGKRIRRVYNIDWKRVWDLNPTVILSILMTSITSDYIENDKKDLE
jgi:hypothetical protein